MVDRQLHPDRGPHEPTSGTLDRLPGTLRRTSSLDMRRPGGLDGMLVADGRSRDLYTSATGGVVTLGAASLSAEIDFTRGRVLRSLATEPSVEGLSALIGETVAGGFRRRLDGLAPQLAEERSLPYLLLDDLPVATLVSGFALGAAGRRTVRLGPNAERPPTPDLCAGWVDGGAMMLGIQKAGSTPRITGPDAPRLERDDDPIGWHAMSELTPHGVRRRRRLDVQLEQDLCVDAMFRDSHVDQDGLETVIHEYSLHARIDPVTMVVIEAVAVPRVLPWKECPRAAASARRLAGMSTSQLRARVRAELHGPSTCTHLNDLLRSVEDVVALAPVLAERNRG